jgi:cob(I)alamin adenosyltransferase
MARIIDYQVSNERPLRRDDASDEEDDSDSRRAYEEALNAQNLQLERLNLEYEAAKSMVTPAPSRASVRIKLCRQASRYVADSIRPTTKRDL